MNLKIYKSTGARMMVQELIHLFYMQQNWIWSLELQLVPRNQE